ncbi:hypothetical protein [Marinoscillum sp.]|uniref:hypothetical protein n=1 Tax=Marinoscillum sp. TaxID=2024838 RepID=UPI003BAA58F7
MKLKSLLSLTFLFLFLVSQAQNDEDDYNTEIIWGLTKNTNSGLIGGGIFKLARRQKDNVFTTYGVEIVNVKHPKEYRYPSPSGTYFTFGKQNFLYSIRGNYGREKLFFKKAPQQGVQISGIVAAGPTIGIIAPYYVLTSSGYEQYDPQKHTSRGSIQGSGKLFQGLGESNITLGLNAKAGLSFEFGAFKNNVAGVEVGISMEAFPKEIVIIPTQDNRAIFTALYFSMYWGTRK